jgi:predicted membrane protein
MRIKYRRDRRTLRLTLIISLALLALSAAMILFIHDVYLRAWLIAILLAVILLYILSIPRYISLKDGTLEIHCVVELTRIRVEDILSVKRVSRGDLNILLLLGSYGFFGYYGYYADMAHWDTIKVYATEWDNLVLIEDIYETRYLVSCTDADRLIEGIKEEGYCG